MAKNIEYDKNDHKSIVKAALQTGHEALEGDRKVNKKNVIYPLSKKGK